MHCSGIKLYKYSFLYNLSTYVCAFSVYVRMYVHMLQIVQSVSASCLCTGKLSCYKKVLMSSWMTFCVYNHKYFLMLNQPLALKYVSHDIIVSHAILHRKVLYVCVFKN